MQPFVILLILVLYIVVLLLISRVTADKNQSNTAFFNANRRSKWYVVAFGMIGSSVSGISLVSVPGMVLNSGFTYLQTAIGFFFGYVAVALILLPLYYKLNLTSIYEYLNRRFGSATHKTGSWFFVVSKIIMSASRLYIAVLVLQIFLFDNLKIPFWLSVTLCVAVIWLYTNKGGIKTIVWTDFLQSFILFAVIILMIFKAIKMLDFSLFDAVKSVKNSELSCTFVFSDFVSGRNFFKQFFSGIFIVIVMTGLSQDMMQTTLSCKNLKEARKNMLFYGAGFVPLNFLLLFLGALLIIFAQKNALILPEKPDEMVPFFASSVMGNAVFALFILGIIAATFNSADGALAGIVTAISVDILQIENTNNKVPPPALKGAGITYLKCWLHFLKAPFRGLGAKQEVLCTNTSFCENLRNFCNLRSDENGVFVRKIIYFLVCVVFILLILLFQNIKNQSIIDTIYIIVGYAYGPLLGLFAFGLFTKFRVKDKAIPFLAILSPVLTYGISYFCKIKFHYSFGYEILLLNGALMFALMFIFRGKNRNRDIKN